MEEKKSNIKVASMNAGKENKENKEKNGRYSYDELNNICGQLYQENQRLVKHLQQLNQTAAFQRIEFLLRIVELSDKIKDADFIGSCISELKETMTIAEPEKGDNAEGKEG